MLEWQILELQPLQRTGHFRDVLRADVRVDARCLDRAVAEQGLDDHQIRPRFQEMCGKTVAQRIHRLPANSSWRGLPIVFTRSMSAA